MVHFLDLPPELRCMIYEDLLAPTAVKPIIWGVEKRELLGINPTILRTCKQVYNEALPYIYNSDIPFEISISVCNHLSPPYLRFYTPRLLKTDDKQHPHVPMGELDSNIIPHVDGLLYPHVLRRFKHIQIDFIPWMSFDSRCRKNGLDFTDKARQVSSIVQELTAPSDRPQQDNATLTFMGKRFHWDFHYFLKYIEAQCELAEYSQELIDELQKSRQLSPGGTEGLLEFTTRLLAVKKFRKIIVKQDDSDHCSRGRGSSYVWQQYPCYKPVTQL